MKEERKEGRKEGSKESREEGSKEGSEEARLKEGRRERVAIEEETVSDAGVVGGQ